MSFEYEGNSVTVLFKHDGIEEEVEGVMEDKFVRFPKQILERLPGIRDAVLKEGGVVNNIWGILKTDSGEFLKKGQELRARVRVGRRGAYAIAATTAVLGIIVAIKTSQQPHHE